MQSGYGGVSEFQQFIMDGGFAMAAAPHPPHPPPTQQQQQQAAHAHAAAAGAQELGAPFRYQPLHHHAMHPQQHHHHAPPQMPPHFAHFGGPTAAGGGGIPFTQQLLHHQASAAATGHHHHHLQLFHEQQHHHHQQQQQQQHHKPQPQPPPPARWAPPQHHHQHHQQHLGLDMETAVPESSRAAAAAAAPSGMPPFLAAAMSFKLAVDASGSGATGGTDDAMNDGGGGSGMMLHGGAGGADEEAATESRLRRWTGEEEASIKEPAWRPLDIDFIHSTSSSSKRAAGKDNKAPTPESPSPVANAAANYFKKCSGGDDNVTAAAAAAAAGGGNNSYKLFSELEAIYKPGSGGGAGQTTGSGSGLTGDDNAMADLPHAPPTMGPDDDLPQAPPQANASETSAGEETPAVLQPQPQPSPALMADTRRKRKRRRQQEQAATSAAASSFFERLVQRLMEHQEALHAQFLDAMDRRERERAARDEAWRRQESENFARERAARAQDRASAAAREAAIVAYLEKLSGEPIVLPPPPARPASTTTNNDDVIMSQPQHEASSVAGRELVPYDAGSLDAAAAEGSGMRLLSSSPSRWPKQEVEALIRVRSGLERRFQEPGLKGPLWEEVSTRMAAAGYGGRSAKRCKEKWENINKYFRKAKESGKKRPAHAKTCPYFDELNRLYSGRDNNADDSNATMNAGDGAAGPGKAASSELLDAVVQCPAGAAAAADQSTHYGSPPGFPRAGDGGNEGRRELIMDGAKKYNDGEDEDMGRSSGGRAMAATDQEEDEGESHGGHHDDDEEDHH